MAVSTPTNLHVGAIWQRHRHRQRHRLAAAAAILTALSLSACKPSRTDPPAPMANQSPMAAGSVNNSAGDTSVPSAGAVLAPGAAAKPDTTSGRTNTSMTRAQESTAMPMPGQNNDHSAPLSTASSVKTGKPAISASASAR